MSFKPKSHKGLGDEEWMARLRAFASDGVWPSNAGNRPAPRQKKWHALYQKIEKCPIQSRGQTILFGVSATCDCGFHAAEPAFQPPPPVAPQSVASESTSSAPRSFLRAPPSISKFIKSRFGGSHTNSLKPNLVVRKPPGPSPSSVRTPSLAPSSVRTPSLAPSSVRNPSLAPSFVRTPSLAPSFVRNPSLAPSFVRTPSLAPSSVRTPSLAPSSVRTPSLAPSSVRNPSLAPSFVRTPSLAPSSVRNPSLAPSFVRNPSLAPSFVRTPSLAPSSVRTPSLAPSSVRNPSLAPSFVRTPSLAPSSVRTSGPSPSSVRTPSLASSSTTPTHICQTVSPEEPSACGLQSDAAGDAGPGWLPSEMRKNIPVQDQRWMGNTLFHAGKVRPDLKLWYEPPVPALIYHQVPTPDRFFTHRLLVWMPYHQWKVRVFCQACGKHLTGAGVHKRARKVLDIDRYYLLVTETLRCSGCNLTYLSTSQTIRDQLDLPHQKMFRLILTQKYACDIRVIRLLPPHAPALAPTKAPRKLTRKVLHNTCKKCGQFRIAETGHSQYRGHIYCPSNESMTKELWLEHIKMQK